MTKKIKTNPTVEAEYPVEMKQNAESIRATNTDGHECFTIVDKEGTFYIAIGNNVITRETFNSLEEAKAYIDSKPWDIIINCMAVMYTQMKKQEQI